MTSWDHLPPELKQIIFEYKRLNHFQQRVQTLSKLFENRKSVQQNGNVHLFISKTRGTSDRPLRCLKSKCIKITGDSTSIVYLCHLTKLAVVIESHELKNNQYQSVINYNWNNDLTRLKSIASNFSAKSLYKSLC